MFCLTSLCCICLSKDGHLIKLNKSQDGSIELIKQLHFCFPDAVQNNIVTDKICSRCSTSLQIAYEFKKLYLCSENKFKLLMAQFSENSDHHSLNLEDTSEGCNYLQESGLELCVKKEKSWNTKDCDLMETTETRIEYSFEENLKLPHSAKQLNSEPHWNTYCAQTTNIKSTKIKAEYEDITDCISSSPACRSLQELSSENMFIKNENTNFLVAEKNNLKKLLLENEEKKDTDEIKKECEQDNDLSSPQHQEFSSVYVVSNSHIYEDENISHADENTCHKNTEFQELAGIKARCNRQLCHTMQKEYESDNYSTNLLKVFYPKKISHEDDKNIILEKTNCLDYSKNVDTGVIPYECDKCHKKFMQINDFEAHKTVHMVQKPFECSRCHKQFRYSISLSKHRKKHRAKHPHECENCCKTFRYLSSFLIHKRMHTGEKPYECDQCHKKFARMGNVNRHKKIHSGEKPYECDICHKTFVIFNALKIHRRIHTGERPYKCNKCDKKFTFASNLRIHEKIHSKDNPGKSDEPTAICIL